MIENSFAQYFWSRILAFAILLFMIRFIALRFFDPHFYIGASREENIIVFTIVIIFAVLLYIVL